MATIIDGSLAPRGKKVSFPNGMEWYESNITSGRFPRVHYADGLWVAGSTNEGLYYSLNGKTWAQSNITSLSFISLYKADGLWIAGGYNTGLYYSIDGKIWKQSNITSGHIFSIYNANGLWVVGGSSSKGILYSVDGKTWTSSNITSKQIDVIYYADGLWVAGSTENGYYYSTNGKTWTQSNISSGYANSIYKANGLWVLGGDGIYYSTDGKTWTQSNITSNSMTIHYYNGVWVAGDGSQQTGLYFSTDGKSWSPAICNYEFVQVNGIFGSSGIYIAAAIGGDRTGSKTGASYSIDGKTWYMIPLKDNAYAYAMYAANGMWVAATSQGLYYSPTWEVSTPPRTVSEEWVLKSSVIVSPLTIPGESGFLTLPLEADFSSGLTAYDKFVLVEDGSSSLSLGDHFTI